MENKPHVRMHITDKIHLQYIQIVLASPFDLQLQIQFLLFSVSKSDNSEHLCIQRPTIHSTEHTCANI